VSDPLGRVVGTGKNALAGSNEYEVVGPVTPTEEGPASDVLDRSRSLSDKRRVWMRVYGWRSSNDERLLVTVVSDVFQDANPPRCGFTNIQFVRVDRSGAEELMLAGDYSGLSTIGVRSVILAISNQRLKPVMSVPTMVLYEAELENADVHTLTLDDRRTLLVLHEEELRREGKNTWHTTDERHLGSHWRRSAAAMAVNNRGSFIVVRTVGVEPTWLLTAGT
jgi:hypothetical protein